MSGHAIENAKAHVDGIVELLEAIEKAEETQEKVMFDGYEYDADGLRDRALESALEVSVRSDWHTPGSDSVSGEYLILLSTGGPALRITGYLNEHKEPETARVEWQDWGEPWTEYSDTTPEQDDDVLSFARLFYFGE